MRLSRNKLNKILKIRTQTKKKHGNKKKRKRARKRSFRENKLNLKKNTLRFKKGGAKTTPLRFAKYAAQNTIEKILYIQLLILNWRKTFLQGKKCYVVPYSTDPDSYYMKFFGSFIKSNKSVLKSTDKNSGFIKTILKIPGSFTTPYPGGKTNIIWSLLHHYACQINGYFIIEEKGIEDPKKRQFNVNLAREPITFFGSDMVVPGQSYIEGNNIWQQSEGEAEVANFKNLCEYIITPTEDSVNSVSMWLQNTWGLQYGGDVRIYCNKRQRQQQDIVCPLPSRLSDKNPKRYLTMKEIKRWGLLMQQNALSQVACLKEYNLKNPDPNLATSAKRRIEQFAQKAEEYIQTQKGLKNDLMGKVDRFCNENLLGSKPISITSSISIITGIKTNSNLTLTTCVVVNNETVMNSIYNSIINNYLRAPTDEMLDYWWQKETLLFLPLLETQSIPVIQSPPIPIPRTYIDAVEKGLIKNIPKSVKQLIIRRVNGIVIRKKKVKRKDVGDEKYKKERVKNLEKTLQIKERLLQECLLNYVRAQISKNILLKKMDGCINISTAITKAQRQERVFKDRLIDKISKRGKMPEYNVLDNYLNKKFQEELSSLSVGSNLGRLRETMFTIQTRTIGGKVEYIYTPITIENWIKINILSAHQLMLECWSMPLDSPNYKGEDTIVYRVPSILLTKEEFTRGLKKTRERIKQAKKGNIENDGEYQIGDDVFYINKITGADQLAIKGKERLQFAKCKIIGINIDQEDGNTYDIQFTEKVGMQSDLDYIPRQSPLWIKFRLLINYLVVLNPFLNDEFRPLFKETTIVGVRKLKQNNNILQLLTRYEAFSNKKSSKLLNISEIRVRLCKLWILFTALMGWCNYENLMGPLPLDTKDKNRVILARTKRVVRNKDAIAAKITGSTAVTSCGWAEIETTNKLKLRWLDRWRKNPKKNLTKRDAVCRRALLSSGDCYVKQELPKRLGYWPTGKLKQIGDGGPVVSADARTSASLVGGGDCDIREILLRVKIPAGDNLTRNMSENIKNLATPYTVKAMNDFAKNFKITKIMLNPESCNNEGKCEYDKQCTISRTSKRSQSSIAKSEADLINCIPIVAPYSNENIIRWIQENRNRRTPEECREEQRLFSGEVIYAAGPPDSTTEKVGKALGAAATATGKGLKTAATATGKGLKTAATATGKGLKKAASAVGDQFTNENSFTRRNLRSMGNRITERIGKARSLLNKTRKNRAPLNIYEQMNTSSACDAECQRNIRDQQFISILIQPTPGIPPGYIVSVVQKPSGPGASQAIATLSKALSGEQTTDVGSKQGELGSPQNPIIPNDDMSANIPVGTIVIDDK